jgi:hypothetical protein
MNPTRPIWFLDSKTGRSKRSMLKNSDLGVCTIPPSHQIGRTCYYYAVIGLLIVSPTALRTILDIMDCLHENIPARDMSVTIDKDTPSDILAIVIIDHVYQYAICRAQQHEWSESTLPLSPLKARKSKTLSSSSSSSSSQTHNQTHIQVMNMQGQCDIQQGGHFNDILDRFIDGISRITRQKPVRMFNRISMDDMFGNTIIQIKKHTRLPWQKFMEECVVGILVGYIRRPDGIGHGIAFWFDPTSFKFYKYDSNNGSEFRNERTSLDPRIILDQIECEIQLGGKLDSATDTDEMSISCLLSIPNLISNFQDHQIHSPFEFQYLTASYIVNRDDPNSLRIAIVSTSYAYVLEFDDSGMWTKTSNDKWFKMTSDHPNVPSIDIFQPRFLYKFIDRVHTSVKTDPGPYNIPVEVLSISEPSTFVVLGDIIDELDKIIFTIPNFLK